jgi:hypothetical protein
MRIADWPRGLRQTLYWIAILVTCLILVPAFVIGVMYLTGFGPCHGAGAGGRLCAPPGRELLAVVLIAGGVALFAPLGRFLQRSLIGDGILVASRNVSAPLPGALPSKAMSLPFGQELVVGRIESRSRSGRVMVVAGNSLTLWSLYPFQKGWIKEGDELALVYQKSPFGKNRKYALAFWNGAPNPVRGIAALTQSGALLIAATCIWGFSAMRGPSHGVWIAICSYGALISALYLLLMLRAKAALRHFIATASPGESELRD